MKQIWRIVRFTSSLWRLYVAVALFSILAAGVNQIQPLLVRDVIDEVTKLVQGQSANTLAVVILALFIFLTDVAGTLLSNVGGYYGDVLAAKLNKLMSERYYRHILTLSQRYFDNELSGKIINRLNRGVNQISNFIGAMSSNFLQQLLMSTLSLGIIFAVSWQVGLMLLALYPIFIYLTVKTSGKWTDYQHQINQNYDIATGRFAEVVNQIKVVTSFRHAKRELRLFSDKFTDSVETTKPQSRYWHSRDVYRRLALNIIFLGVYTYIFVAAAHGEFSVGTMVLLILYAANIRIPLFSISFIVNQMQRATANTKDYFEVMDQQPDIYDWPGAAKLVIKHGQVEFDGVKFSYNDKIVLEDISFVLEAGSKNALVGQSGAGKTTIASLLQRLYDVDAGVITIDGQDISGVTQASLRGQIGVVFQEPMLFSGTIRENIAYANPKATMQEIEAAARAANAHEFIAKLEKGYDSEIGERGLKLSGGQKQRIAIARAVLKDAPILILDEATSSLDTKSERQVQQALERLMKGRTTLIIAHRLSTIQSVDQIITLDDGRVGETGTPAELAESGGIYAELLKLQDLHTEASAKKIQKYDIAR